MVLRAISGVEEDFVDPRIDHYFLLGSPLKILAVLGLYFYFVKNIGPKFMQSRKPFEINQLVAIYNILQVALNATLTIAAVKMILSRGYSVHCMRLDRTSEQGLYEAKLTYFYYMLKVFDLIDTIIMVLRKRTKQITFLHIYHHSLVAFAAYLYTRSCPGGHISLVGAVNCFVHVVMYFYYFLTSFNPQLKSSIWWKRHITHLQMLQFAALFLHTGYPLVVGGCSYPKIWLIFTVVQNLVFFILFSNFYIKEYIQKKNQIKQK